MKKALRKAIMKRSELESKYVKNKASENLNNATNKMKFWKTVKLFLFDKVNTFPKISLIENGEMILDESKVANLFSNVSENAIHPLGIKENK